MTTNNQVVQPNLETQSQAANDLVNQFGYGSENYLVYNGNGTSTVRSNDGS